MQFPRPQTFPVLHTQSLPSDRATPPARNTGAAVNPAEETPHATGSDSAAAGATPQPPAAETFRVQRPLASRRQVLSMQHADRQEIWQEQVSKQRQQISQRLDHIHSQLRRLAGTGSKTEQPQLSVVGLPPEE